MGRPRKNPLPEIQTTTKTQTTQQLSEEKQAEFLEQLELSDEQMKKFSRIISNGLSNNPIWMNEILKNQTTRSTKYKKEDIQKMVETSASHETQLREVAMYLYNTSPYLKRIIFYLASICTLDHLLIPYMVDEVDVKTKPFKKAKLQVYNWLDSFNIKSEFFTVLQSIILEDVYFGYLRSSEDCLTLQKLPSIYCKLIRKTNIGYDYAFNFMYFLNPLVDINNYPEEFQKHYLDVKAGKRTDANGKLTQNGSYYWIELSNNAVAFKFDTSTGIIAPPLMGIFPDCIDIDEYKNLIKEKLTLDIQKLVYQKIPMKSDKDAKKGEFLISLEHAGQFHNNAKANMPKNVGIVTTPMEMNAISFDKQAQTKDSLIGLGESNFFKAGGFSEVLFSSDGGNIGLNYNIQTDYEFMKHCVGDFAKWINYQFKKTGGKYKFKIFFPDISIFNREDLLTSSTNLGTLGYSKRLIACYQGLSPQDFESLLLWENGEEITTQLIPLASSHTGGLGLDQGGAPTKKTKDLTDAGITTKDNGDNANRQ